MVETSKTNKDIVPSSTTVHFLVRACVRLAKEATDAEEAMEAAESAFGLLRQQRRDHAANSRTTAKGGTNHLGNMEPDVNSYSMVIEAFAQVGSYEGAKQAEHVMAMLQREYELHQSPKLRPTVNTYNSLIRAWTHMRKGKSLTRFSERWVREIEEHPDIRPNLRTYTLELQSWARAASNETAQQVLKILMKLRKNSKDNEQLAHLRPTLSMYNLGKCWSVCWSIEVSWNHSEYFGHDKVPFHRVPDMISFHSNSPTLNNSTFFFLLHHQ